MGNWVKFQKAGPPHGFAYSPGDVAELSEEACGKLYAAGAIVPASPEEVEKAKAAIESEAAANADKQKHSPEFLKGQNLDLQAEKAELQKQLAALQAQLAGKDKK